jgi:prepilin-type N-terminal cleavage/methylation domain-containing protein
MSRETRATATRGFSLIEVMVAMAIGTVVMLATMPLISYAIRRGAEGRHLTTAQQLASEILENLRNELRYDAGAGSPGSAEFDDAWAYDVLPHAVKDASAPAAAAEGGVSCQPAGQDDGVTYHYGPYPFAREGNTFYACYALLQAAASDPKGNARTGIPAGSGETIVRVLWRDPAGGWSSWALGGLLHAGT